METRIKPSAVIFIDKYGRTPKRKRRAQNAPLRLSHGNTKAQIRT